MKQLTTTIKQIDFENEKRIFFNWQLAVGRVNNIFDVFVVIDQVCGSQIIDASLHPFAFYLMCSLCYLLHDLCSPHRYGCVCFTAAWGLWQRKRELLICSSLFVWILCACVCVCVRERERERERRVVLTYIEMDFNTEMLENSKYVRVWTFQIDRSLLLKICSLTSRHLLLSFKWILAKLLFVEMRA